MEDLKTVKLTFELSADSRNKFKSIVAKHGVSMKEALNIAVQMVIRRKNLKDL